ncbi:MAG: Gfo/Idh/MocA family oxidoreductase [Chloroflexi bacterium]|nr:Gfo/Idh/MocA family oxidoreductase [Chloroflexota bacterium]
MAEANGRIRMAIIGCGGNMSGHVKRLVEQHTDEVEIVALVDPSGASIERLIERSPAVADVPRFESHREMLVRVRPDAVEISTPHTLHFEHIMDSLEAGAHVLTEKPMVCEVEHAVQVIERSRELGKVLLVSYQRHYQPLFRYIKQQIDAGELGGITFIHGLQNQNWYRGTQGKWRSKLALSGGGQLNDSGSHLLDILLYTTGLQVEQAHCFQESFEGEVDINSAISLRFRNGAMGTISVIGNAPGGMWEDITLYGSQGSIYYRTSGVRGEPHRFQQRWFDRPGVVTEPELPAGSDPDTNFVDAIKGRAEVESPAVCGLRVIELTEAAWRSATTGQPATVRRVEV